MSEINLNIEILSIKGLNSFNNKLNYFQLHILFNQQIHRSFLFPSKTSTTTNSSNSLPSPLQEEDLIINYLTTFSLPNSFLSNNLNSLLNSNLPILIYITIINDLKDSHNYCGISTSRSLIAAAVIDYRYSFLQSNEYLSIELLPCELDGIHLDITSGILFTRLYLTNLPISFNLSIITQQEIEDMIWNYQKKIANENRTLFHFIKNWWLEALQKYPHIKNYIIKIITEDELGSHRLVCSLLSSIQSHRFSLINPRYSARFVSLIPFHRDVSLIGGRVETWRSSYGTLCRLQGDVEDHVILLCSMLMGWGLDAWIGLGTIVSISNTTSNSHTNHHINTDRDREDQSNSNKGQLS